MRVQSSLAYTSNLEPDTTTTYKAQPPGMSSAAVFVPRAFGITLKRPKKQKPSQNSTKECRVSNCKQIYDPDIPANKSFYATLSYAQQDRRNYCPMHAAMAIDDDGASLKKPKASGKSAADTTGLSTKRTLGFGASTKTSRIARQRSVMPSSPRSSISSSQNSFLSVSTARKSSDDLLPPRSEILEQPVWEEKSAKTTFGFENIGDDIEGLGYGTGATR